MIDKKMIAIASHVNLAEYLISRGEDLKKCGQGYTLKQHDSLRFYGNTFHWYSKSEKGDSIKFLCMYYHMTFYSAVKELLRFSNVSPAISAPEESKFSFPFNDKSCDERRVLAYLCKKRSLKSEIIFSLIKQGLLYQDTRGNCNFVIRDWDEQPIGIEIVGTGDTRYKQITTHSGYGFHIICGQPDSILFFESAIDLLSFYQIYHNSITHHALVSMGGLNSSVLNGVLSLSPDLNIWLCVDNDEAEDDFIIQVKQLSIPFKVFRTKSFKDWNELLMK